jgi:hypothetical protein
LAILYLENWSGQVSIRVDASRPARLPTASTIICTSILLYWMETKQLGIPYWKRISSASTVDVFGDEGYMLYTSPDGDIGSYCDFF